MSSTSQSPTDGFARFTLSTPRPLPVIVLADVSGSMTENGKIAALNGAMRDMLAAFAGEDELRSQIQVAVITFGDGGASVHQPLAPAAEIVWEDLFAYGGTPLGAALEQARLLVEDKAIIPSRAYRPTVVLITDGQPTDGSAWRTELAALLQSERGGKAFRMAMGIGSDADLAMLKEFLADPSARVFTGADSRHITEFFKKVSMSVTSRSRSTNPNQAAPFTSDLDY